MNSQHRCLCGMFCLMLILLTACGGSGSNFQSGVTTTTFCASDFFEFTISNNGGTESYTLKQRLLGSTPLTATGTHSGNSLLLQVNTNGMVIDFNLTVSNDESAVTGTATVSMGSDTMTMNLHGLSGSCPTFDYPNLPAPQVVSANFVNVANIEDISKFRSAYGHDYSDDFETCRSMKHYLSPPLAKRINNTVAVYAPISGTIVHLETEEPGGFVDDGITNQKMIIQAADNPAVLITLFHLDLASSTLAVGANVTAGQQLGHGRFTRAGNTSHDFDIAVHINTPGGVRYVSVFELMTSSVFANYASFSSNLSDFIISNTVRDADIVTCTGETFNSSGTISNWFYNLP